MTEPPKTVAEFEDLLAKAKDAKLLPIMAWNAIASGGGLAFPLQNLMAAYGDHANRSTTGSSRSRTRPSTRRATSRPRSTSSSGSRTATSPRTPTRSSTRTPTPASARARGVFMFNGDWQNAVYDKDQPGKVGFFVFPPAEDGGQGGGHVGAPDLRHRGQREERRLRGVLLQLGGHHREGSRDRRHRRRLEPRRPARPARSPGAAGSVTNETLAAGGDVAKDNGAMDFIANATGSIFFAGLDAQAPEARRRQEDAARPPQGRPGRVHWTTSRSPAADEADRKACS